VPADVALIEGLLAQIEEGALDDEVGVQKLKELV